MAKYLYEKYQECKEVIKLARIQDYDVQVLTSLHNLVYHIYVMLREKKIETEERILGLRRKQL